MAFAQDVKTTNDSNINSFLADTSSFIAALQAAAAAQPNTVIPDGEFFESYIIRTTDDSRSDLVGELNTFPVPNVTTFTYTLPDDVGDAPTDFQLSAVTVPSVPNFVDAAPTLDFPTAPTLTTTTAPSEPTLNPITLPTAPTITLPDVPVLTNVVIPDAPSLTIPLFTETFPETPDLLVPTDDFAYVEEIYQNDLLDSIELLLEGDIDNGGYGITSDDEEATFSRGLDREVRANQGRERQIEDNFAKRGFRAPPGSYAELSHENRNQTMQAISDINRDVMIARADLMRRAREFAVQQGIGLNDLLIRDFGFRQERALNAARFAAEFGITILDAKIRQHNLKIAAFQAFAQSYEVRIRALLAQTDIFKSQIEAASITQEINSNVVDVYEAQIGAAQTVISLYESQLQASQTSAEIENLKIQQFEAQVRAFTSQIQANSEQVNVFEAQIRAEGTKQSAYATQVEAYKSRVSAAKTQVDAELGVLQGDIRAAELELASHETKVRQFATEATAETNRFQSQAAIFGEEVNAYRAVLSGWTELIRAEIAGAESSTRVNQEEARIQLDRIQLRIAEIENERSRALEASKSGSAVYENLLAAAVSVQQTLGVEESTG